MVRLQGKMYSIHSDINKIFQPKRKLHSKYYQIVLVLVVGNPNNKYFDKRKVHKKGKMQNMYYDIHMILQLQRMLHSKFLHKFWELLVDKFKS